MGPSRMFSGPSPQTRPFTTTKLREWAAERAGIHCGCSRKAIASSAIWPKTIALVPAPNPERNDDQNRCHLIAPCANFTRQDEEARKAFVLDAWTILGGTRNGFIFNKTHTVVSCWAFSQKLMTPLPCPRHRPNPNPSWRIGSWGNLHPDDNKPAHRWSRRRCPLFCRRVTALSLLSGLRAGSEPQRAGDPQDWRAEWKWDGIRAKLNPARRRIFRVSRGEELSTEPVFRNCPRGGFHARLARFWMANCSSGPMVNLHRQSFNALQSPYRAQDRAEEATGRSHRRAARLIDLLESAKRRGYPRTPLCRPFVRA